jgi:hypothetical protein
MTQDRKPRGGVLTSGQDNNRGLIELLTFHLRERLELVYYDHANEIDTSVRHDFIVVFSLADLEAVVKFFDAKRQLIPLLVHIDEPEVLSGIRHDLLFPGIKILSTPQADLDSEPDVTLELSLFSQIVDRFEGED